MLKQADGSYACIAESATRFTLSEVYICFKPYAPVLLLVVINIEYAFGLIIWCALDQRRTVESAGTARGRRKLTRISSQRLQGSSHYHISFFHLYIVLHLYAPTQQTPPPPGLAKLLVLNISIVVLNISIDSFYEIQFCLLFSSLHLYIVSFSSCATKLWI